MAVHKGGGPLRLDANSKAIPRRDITMEHEPHNQARIGYGTVKEDVPFRLPYWASVLFSLPSIKGKKCP
jgi:hypothetical protein